LDSIIDKDLNAAFSASANEFLQHSVFVSYPSVSMSAIIDASKVFKQITEYLFYLISRFILQVERGNASGCKITRSDSSVTFATMDSSYSIKWNRLYRGSEHEFSAAAFHRLCDNRGPTVVLARAWFGRVAAGYSCVSWNSSGGGLFESNPNGFLCAIDENDLSLQIFKAVSGECTIQNHSNYGPIFTMDCVSLTNATRTSLPTLSSAGRLRGTETSLLCLDRKTLLWLSMRSLVLSLLSSLV
jgi:hypothetical protein